MTVTVVTGAARGMGRAALERLRGTADHLVAVDLATPQIEGAIGIACDVSDPAGIARLVDEVRGLGPFRSLVHAAGISPTMADARRIFEVDLVGTHLLLEAFEPLVEPGSSAVCWASSAAYTAVAPDGGQELNALIEDPGADGFLDRVAALCGDSGIAYGWAKRGVIRAAARACVPWGRRGGRVNSISPGLVETPQSLQEFKVHPIMQTMLEMTPLGRVGRPEETAALVAFLLSDEASFVSGIDMLIDGGMRQGMAAAGL